MNQIFLPADQLGLILPAFQRIQLLTTKRQKATAMKSFCSTLKGLGLVKKTLDIHSVALGCEVDGSYGLFVNWRDLSVTHVAGQTGPELPVRTMTNKELNLPFNPLEP